MWLHHDLGWWGVVLAIVALLLMIPASILANMITPILLNWFSMRSRRSLRNRIMRLETRLADLEKIAPIDEVQNEILWQMARIRRYLVAVQVNIIGVVYIGVAILSPDTKSRTFTLFAVATMLILTLEVVLSLVITFRPSWRYQRSPSVRRRIRQEIEQLKAAEAARRS